MSKDIEILQEVERDRAIQNTSDEIEKLKLELKQVKEENHKLTKAISWYVGSYDRIQTSKESDFTVEELSYIETITKAVADDAAEELRKFEKLK